MFSRVFVVWKAPERKRFNLVRTVSQAELRNIIEVYSKLISLEIRVIAPNFFDLRVVDDALAPYRTAIFVGLGLLIINDQNLGFVLDLYRNLLVCLLSVLSGGVCFYFEFVVDLKTLWEKTFYIILEHFLCEFAP